MAAAKHRIWELDAFRGVAILAVIVIHLLFDLEYFLGISLGYENPVFQFVKQYGGVVFVVLSGTCVTLGSRSVRRGLIVFGCAMAVTLVTYGMVWLGLDIGSIVVKFGVLHLLGLCMLLWPLFRRLPTWALLAIGIPVVALGYWFATFHVASSWLFPLGLTSAGFTSSDFFPLFPHLGWFLLGAVLGRTVYKDKKTRLSQVHEKAAPVRFFCWCGRMSLFLYLFHQPVLYGLVNVLALVR